MTPTEIAAELRQIASQVVVATSNAEHTEAADRLINLADLIALGDTPTASDGDEQRPASTKVTGSALLYLADDGRAVTLDRLPDTAVYAFQAQALPEDYPLTLRHREIVDALWATYRHLIGARGPR